MLLQLYTLARTACLMLGMLEAAGLNYLFLATGVVCCDGGEDDGEAGEDSEGGEAMHRVPSGSSSTSHHHDGMVPHRELEVA